VPRAWRLLLDDAASGPWNMGVDEALLHSVAAGGPSTLRLYGWRGPWLSLGYGQRVDADRLAAYRAAGLGVVRRVTGGWAVLHGGDLTYALAAPEDALPPGLRASYELVSRALRVALRDLGVEAAPSLSEALGVQPRSFDCFARAAADELCAGGRKLAGSAQRRTAAGVLQHGSIRVHPDPPELRAAAGLSSGVATSLRELGCRHGEAVLREAFVAGFREVLGVGLERGVLDPSEEDRARRRPWTLSADLRPAPRRFSGDFSRAPRASR
jgi:lipoate-protein ligase A